MEKTEKPYLQPILKYLGGKGRFIKNIQPIYEKHRDKRWVDLFCGGLALPLAFNPQEVLINDSNEYLINFYLLVSLFGSVDSKIHINEKEHYYKMRERFNELISDPQWKGKIATHGIPIANIYYYLNRTGFNGLMRFSQKGKFNTPFGNYKYTKYSESWPEHQKLFRKWKIYNLDWKECYDKHVKPSDFVYSDSPYDTDFTMYTADGFTWENQVELAHTLAKHNGPVLANNQATDRIVELYTDLGFDIQYVERKEKVGGVKRKRGQIAVEMYATKNLE